MAIRTHPPFAIISLSSGRGYEITDHSPDLSSYELRLIWRKARPFGEGWSAYIGAESIKCFRLACDKLAIAQTQVTHQQDEYGRTGILFTRVELFNISEYSARLKSMYRNALSAVRLSKVKLSQPSILQIVQQILLNRQIILAYKYTDRANWHFMEAIILKSILSLPVYIQPWISFTTFALSPYGESFIIGIPLKAAKRARKRYICIALHGQI
jgi:hypothetical protein